MKDFKSSLQAWTKFELLVTIVAFLYGLYKWIELNDLGASLDQYSGLITIIFILIVIRIYHLWKISFSGWWD